MSASNVNEPPESVTHEIVSATVTQHNQVAVQARIISGRTYESHHCSVVQVQCSRSQPYAGNDRGPCPNDDTGVRIMHHNKTTPSMATLQIHQQRAREPVCTDSRCTIQTILTPKSVELESTRRPTREKIRDSGTRGQHISSEDFSGPGVGEGGVSTRGA